MLKTYINTVPYTKFILITDSLENRDIRLFDYMVKQHLTKDQHKIHYCVFEGVFKRTQDKFESYPNILLHNFIFDSDEKGENFEQVASHLGNNDIVIVDSLANAIFRHGLPATYRIFSSLKENKAIKQIISVLHKDLLETSKAVIYFANLSTLSINIEPKFMKNSPRLQYEYKKSGGKIFSSIEEYKFEGEHLITSKICRPDLSEILEKTAPNPEELSTFRIGLTDEEKVSRNKLVLPYLPGATEKEKQEEGKIFYQFDNVDDWDEEDPDDDLDI